jgi:hypothetical protein
VRSDDCPKLKTARWACGLRADAGQRREIAHRRAAPGGLEFERRDAHRADPVRLSTQLWSISSLDVSIHPVIPGKGKSLSRPDKGATMKWAATKVFARGIVKLTYERA